MPKTHLEKTLPGKTGGFAFLKQKGLLQAEIAIVAEVVDDIAIKTG